MAYPLKSWIFLALSPFSLWSYQPSQAEGCWNLLVTSHEWRAPRNALGSVADDSFVGNLSQAGFLCRMGEKSSSMQRSHAPNKQKEAFPPWWGRDRWKSLLMAKICLWQRYEKLTWDPREMEQLSGGALQVGSLGKWVTSGRKSSELEVVGFLEETPHAPLPLCLLPVEDSTWTEWIRFRTFYA